jgi:hypothetical protein
MNHDNLHNPAQILEAFQGCRDAGEQIDLFEALAWRDEPPWEAFMEILRKIKLEPALALAIQALGWVKNAEVLERLKKSDELLEILSNLAMSGATDLIRWSAAKSIIAIGFNFISVSQHLTEMPKDIVKSILSKPESKDTNIFCIYGDSCRIRHDTYGIIGRDLASFDNSTFSSLILQAKDILSRKGIIRGFQENNRYINSGQENIAFTIAGLQIAQGKLLNSKDIATPKEFKVLLLNQIYCINSCSLAVRKSAIKFLYEIDFIQDKEIEFPDLCNLICKIRDLTKNIQTEIKQLTLQQEGYFDEKDLSVLSIDLTFNLTKMSNELNSSWIKSNHELTSNLTKMSNELNSNLKKRSDTITSERNTRTRQMDQITRWRESASSSTSRSLSEYFQLIFYLGLSATLYVFVDISVGNFFLTAICVMAHCTAIGFSVKNIFDMDDDQMGLVISTAVVIVGMSYFFPRIIIHPWMQVMPGLIIVIGLILRYRYLSYKEYTATKDYNYSIYQEEQQSEQEKLELEAEKKSVFSQIEKQKEKTELELKKFREDKEFELEKMRNDNNCALKKIEGYVNDRKNLCI